MNHTNPVKEIPGNPFQIKTSWGSFYTIQYRQGCLDYLYVMDYAATQATTAKKYQHYSLESLQEFCRATALLDQLTS